MEKLIKLNEEKLLFFDLESASVVKELIPETDLYNSWEYKVNKDGEKTQAEVIASYSKEAGLYPEFAKVVSIVVGKIKEGKILLMTFDDKDEKKLLTDFNKMLGRNTRDDLVGFVNTGFDNPFTWKRMLINGIKPERQLDVSCLKPWEISQVDLAKEWQGTSFNRASLINIATAFGLPSPKDDISGADVGRVYWEEGDKGLERISHYCRKDVVTTINIFKKMRLEEPLEVEVGEIKEEVEPLLTKLFKGSAYGKEEKAKLITLLKTLTKEEREKAFVILDALTSKAKGKITKLTKAHVKALKTEMKDEK